MRSVLLAFLTCFSCALFSAEAPDRWGLAFTLRAEQLPYQFAPPEQEHVVDVIPLLFFSQGPLHIDGQQGALRYNLGDSLTFGAIGQFRFFDVPEGHHAEDAMRNHSLDLGLQLRWLPTRKWALELETLRGQGDTRFINTRLRYNKVYSRGELSLDGTVRLKSSEFNQRFYALDQANAEEGVDLSLGARAQVQVVSNLALYGQLKYTRLEKSLLDLPTVSRRDQAEAFAGVALFNLPQSAGKPLDNRAYVRLAWGLATPANLVDVLLLQSTRDPFDNQLTSLFYGHPLSDQLFSLPVAMYLTPGVAWHLPSEVQSKSPEYILAIKGYFDLPLGLRFGFAEGVSYLQNITYVENLSLQKNNELGSQLLNFLDFSLDINLGSLTRLQSLNGAYLGYGIHHRSGLKASSSAFGRINSGSNYQMLYLQWQL